MIRKAINDCFLTLVHETYKFNGVAELLDILASIISGFAVPLREEHVIFFKNVIIPLHKVQNLKIFLLNLMIRFKLAIFTMNNCLDVLCFS